MIFENWKQASKNYNVVLFERILNMYSLSKCKKLPFSNSFILHSLDLPYLYVLLNALIFTFFIVALPGPSI